MEYWANVIGNFLLIILRYQVAPERLLTWVVSLWFIFICHKASFINYIRFIVIVSIILAALLNETKTIDMKFESSQINLMFAHARLQTYKNKTLQCMKCKTSFITQVSPTKSRSLRWLSVPVLAVICFILRYSLR